MSEAKPPVCFTCGQPAVDPPVLHLRADGRPCPACADLVLEAQPSLLPAAPEAAPPSLTLLGGAPEEPAWENEDSPA